MANDCGNRNGDGDGGKKLRMRRGGKERVRALRPKVSTGCITCKIRRIKCNEEKPNCKQCTKTGRICDGYFPLVPKRKNPPTMPPTRPSSPLNANLINILIPGTEQELHSFTFFRQKTVPELCGLFESSFWNRLILQAIHHEPAIRHAAIALGSMHEQFNCGRLRNQEIYCCKFALGQYSRAIRFLVDPGEGRRVEKEKEKRMNVALASCVLFICLETLRGHSGAAMLHVSNGAKIINSMISSSTEKDQSCWNIPLKTLRMVFVRLQFQVSQVIGQQRLLVGNIEDGEIGYQEKVPSCFSTLDEARNSLNYLWAAGLSSMSQFLLGQQNGMELKLSLVCIKDAATIRLNRWSKALELFIRRNSTSLNESIQLGIHTLKIQCIVAGLYLVLDYEAVERDEMLWDNYEHEFELINMHASFVSKIANKGCALEEETVQSTFSISAGICFPLFLVTSKSRDSRIRRKALGILEAAPRQGMVHFEQTATLSKRMIELEEEGYGGREVKAKEVENWRRVTGVHIILEEVEKRARLRFDWWKGEGAEEVWRDEVIEW